MAAMIMFSTEAETERMPPILMLSLLLTFESLVQPQEDVYNIRILLMIQGNHCSAHCTLTSDDCREYRYGGAGKLTLQHCVIFFCQQDQPDNDAIINNIRIVIELKKQTGNI